MSQIVDKIIGGGDDPTLPVKRAQDPNNNHQDARHKQQTRDNQPIELKQKIPVQIPELQFQHQAFGH